MQGKTELYLDPKTRNLINDRLRARGERGSSYADLVSSSSDVTTFQPSRGAIDFTVTGAPTGISYASKGSVIDALKTADIRNGARQGMDDLDISLRVRATPDDSRARRAEALALKKAEIQQELSDEMARIAKRSSQSGQVGSALPTYSDMDLTSLLARQKKQRAFEDYEANRPSKLIPEFYGVPVPQDLASVGRFMQFIAQEAALGKEQAYNRRHAGKLRPSVFSSPAAWEGPQELGQISAYELSRAVDRNKAHSEKARQYIGNPTFR